MCNALQHTCCKPCTEGRVLQCCSACQRCWEGLQCRRCQHQLLGSCFTRGGILSTHQNKLAAPLELLLLLLPLRLSLQHEKLHLLLLLEGCM